MLADQLAEVIGSRPVGARPVVRVGIAGFHHPRAHRYARGTGPDPKAATNRRYVEGQRLYLAQARPREQASWVFDNTDLDRPLLSPRGSAGGSPGAH